MNRLLPFWLISCLFLQFNFASADDIDAKLKDARESYLASEAEFERKLLDWFDSQEKRARNRGDSDAVLTIKVERKKYVDSNSVPKNAPSVLLRSRESARFRLLREYESTIAILKRRGLDAEEELQLLLSDQVETETRSFWLHPDGFFQQTEEGKWQEVSPNGRQYQFSEVARNPEYVELQVIDSDTSIRVRLFDDRAEFANLPQLASVKKLDGWWHSLAKDGEGSNQSDIPILAPGMQFRGEKTWTKIGAVFKRGTKQWHILRIEKVSGQEFSGSVEFEWGKSPVAVDGLTDGHQIQWANSDTRGQAYYGVIDRNRITAVSGNGTISLVHEKN